MTNPTPERLARINLLLAEFEGLSRERRALELRTARVLSELESLEGLEYAGCSSVAQLGERFAMAGREALTLRDLGRTVAALPYVEGMVLQGRLSVAAAACVGEVLTLPPPATTEALAANGTPPGHSAPAHGEDDWIGWAMSEPLPALRRRVRLRLEEARAEGVPLVPVSFFVKEKARDDFDRARTLASRKSGRALTPGETFETVTDHYLDSFDDERVTPGLRRVPDTAYVNGRYVPAAVRREIRERQGDACAVPFCYYARFLEMAHLVPHASGGSREADNLVLLCYVHHGLFDAGQLRMEGTAVAPRFYDQSGHEIGARNGGAGGALDDPPQRDGARDRSLGSSGCVARPDASSPLHEAPAGQAGQSRSEDGEPSSLDASVLGLNRRARPPPWPDTG